MDIIISTTEVLDESNEIVIVRSDSHGAFATREGFRAEIKHLEVETTHGQAKMWAVFQLDQRNMSMGVA